MIPSQEILDAICERVAMGDSRRKACMSQDVDETSFRRWCRQDEARMTQYTRACEERAHSWAEEFIEIADDGRNDWMASNDPENPGYKENGESVRRTHERLDARKWMMARILPKIFGDKLDLNHGGNVGVNLITDIPRPNRS